MRLLLGLLLVGLADTALGFSAGGGLSLAARSSRVGRAVLGGLSAQSRRSQKELMGKINAYKVLGVDTKASAADIKKAYRKMAARYHPDVNSDEGAQDRFVEINTAFEMIGDGESRRRYNLRKAPGLSDDFAERVEFMRKTGGTGYVRVAEKVEAAMEDSRLVILLNVVPAAIFLGIMTFFPDYLHDLVLGAPPPPPDYSQY